MKILKQILANLIRFLRERERERGGGARDKVSRKRDFTALSASFNKIEVYFGEEKRRGRVCVQQHLLDLEGFRIIPIHLRINAIIVQHRGVVHFEFLRKSSKELVSTLIHSAENGISKSTRLLQVLPKTGHNKTPAPVQHHKTHRAMDVSLTLQLHPCDLAVPK